MKAPLEKQLLHDKKFIAMAEAFLRKKKLFVPEWAQAEQIKYQTAQSKAGQDLSLNVCGTPAITKMRDAFEKVKPVHLKQEVITSKKDRVKFPEKDGDWFDKETRNPGQLGGSVFFGETRDQKVPPIPLRYEKPWLITKPKK